MTERVALMDIALTRLFHDLVGPISAAVNGVELIADLGGGSGAGGEDLEEEALALVGDSARQAADRLAFFRVAFGSAGTTAVHSVAMAAKLAEAYLKTRKIGFESQFPPDPAGIYPPPGGVKVCLAFISALCETLPYGGRIAMQIGDAACTEIVLGARGRGAALSPEIAAALEPEVPPGRLTGRSVLACMAAGSARNFGFGFGVEHGHAGDGDAQVTVRLRQA